MLNRVLLAAALVGLAVPAAWSAKPSQRLSDQARGRELYVRHCAACHGPEAAGDGPVAGALIRPVPDLRTLLTDEAREAQVDTILLGRDLMPGFSLSFDRRDARRVWRYMRSVASGDTEREAPPAEPPSEDTDDTEEAGG